MLLAVVFALSPLVEAQTFTCGDSHFGTNDGCDCGCAVADPDCGDPPVPLSACEFDGCANGEVPATADTTQCEADACGNGYRGDDEACDDGNTVGGDGCEASCDAVTPGFLCGDAAEGCQRERCGDGVRTQSERCDDGNNRTGDGCDDTCTDEPGFICYEGFPCQRTFCGDFFMEYDFTTRSGETCDDGNTTSGDGCSAQCEAEPGFFCPPFGGFCERTVCGDGIITGDPFYNLGETCDDQNEIAGDGCDNCVAEPGYICFNGPCHLVDCGDGIVDNNGVTAFEQCDDGNESSNDGCSAVCALEPGFDCFSVPPGEPCREIVCGDGFIGFDQFGFGEACDDGNAVSGDGCDGSCDFVEPGFICSTPGQPCRRPVCGDGERDNDGFSVFEQCDDGNEVSGDGCSGNCNVEDGFECLEEGEPCVALPPGWTCSLVFFDTGDGCDCGCGAQDPDCENDDVRTCDFNHCFDGIDTAIDPCDPTECISEAEAEGRCPLGPPGEGEGEDDDDDDDDDEPVPTCASTSPGALWLLAAVLLRRRRRSA